MHYGFWVARASSPCFAAGWKPVLPIPRALLILFVKVYEGDNCKGRGAEQSSRRPRARTEESVEARTLTRAGNCVSWQCLFLPSLAIRHCTLIIARRFRSGLCIS
jgi:hypothetical protein